MSLGAKHGFDASHQNEAKMGSDQNGHSERRQTVQSPRFSDVHGGLIAPRWTSNVAKLTKQALCRPLGWLAKLFAIFTVLMAILPRQASASLNLNTNDAEFVVGYDDSSNYRKFGDQDLYFATMTRRYIFESSRQWEQVFI